MRHQPGSKAWFANPLAAFIVVWPLAAKCADDPWPRARPIVLAQAGTGPVTLSAYVDRRRNAQERKKLEAFGNPEVVLYEQENAPDRVSIKPDNVAVMRL